MLVLGADPGCAASAWAIYDGAQITATGVLTGPQKDRLHIFAGICAQADLIVVEGQQIYRSTKQPSAIIKLAQQAGRLAAIADIYGTPVLMPLPRAWKGTIPKQIHQARLYRRLGWPYKLNKGKTYAYPEDRQGHLQSHWKDIGDACGLAVWGHDQYTTPAATAAN